MRQMKEISDISKYHYIEEFGSWNAARNAAELEFIQTKFGAAEGEPEGYTPTGSSPSISEEELLIEIRQLESDLERVPTIDDMDEYGDFASGTYYKRFDSWRGAVKAAGFEPRPAPNNQSGANNYNWKGGYGHYSRNWDKIREKVVERDGYECQICGCNNERHQKEYDHSLEVHHIQPARTFDDQEEAHDLSNLMTLCRVCHMKWEGIPLRPQT